MNDADVLSTIDLAIKNGATITKIIGVGKSRDCRDIEAGLTEEESKYVLSAMFDVVSKRGANNA